jgi:hypothetical protein
MTHLALCLGWKPRLQQVVDKGAQVVAQDEQNGQQNNGQQNDQQGIFYKTLSGAIRW